MDKKTTIDHFIDIHHVFFLFKHHKLIILYIILLFYSALILPLINVDAEKDLFIILNLSLNLYKEI